MTERGGAIVVFSIDKWSVRFRMPMPTAEDAARQRAGWLEQQERVKWRALLLTVKAKLVSVENGVESFEEAFLAHLVLPGGATVGAKALPAIAEAYAGKGPPSGRLLLGDGQ